MMKFKTFFTMLLFIAASATASAQGGMAAQKVTPLEIAKSVYSNATQLKKVNAYWYRITDAKGKTLGFAMDGTPYCKTVKGFKGATPMMIVTDKKGTISTVSMLTNSETPNFVRKLVKKGYFSQWNGMSVKQAQAHEIDGYTGATYTGKAVKQNMTFLLKNGANKLPKK